MKRLFDGLAGVVRELAPSKVDDFKRWRQRPEARATELVAAGKRFWDKLFKR